MFPDTNLLLKWEGIPARVRMNEGVGRTPTEVQQQTDGLQSTRKDSLGNLTLFLTTNLLSTTLFQIIIVHSRSMLQTHPTLHPHQSILSSLSRQRDPHQYPSPALSNTRPNAKLWSAKHAASISSTKPLSWIATSHGSRMRELPMPKQTPIPSNDVPSIRRTQPTQANPSYPSGNTVDVPTMHCQPQYAAPYTPSPLIGTSASPPKRKYDTMTPRPHHH